MLLKELMWLLMFLHLSNTTMLRSDKEQFCNEVEECVGDKVNVCGVRWEGDLIRLKIFADQCELLKYGCNVEDKDAYGLIHMNYCNNSTSRCSQVCPEQLKNETLCALRPHKEGFKARLFVNECEINKYNCEYNLTDGFSVTDNFVCQGLDLPEYSKTAEIKKYTEIDNPENETAHSVAEPNRAPKNLIIVDGNMFDSNGDVNDTIDNFFSATHVFDMPLKDVTRTLDVPTRRLILKTYGPVVVYQPWITIPKVKKTDAMHRPTLDSCYHKCPVACPTTYSPVCGNPGTRAREPSVMFKNHCLMDAAQCFMRFQNASYTAPAASYIESTFVFCLGDRLNGMYRFMPLVRTLQRMGRLRKKGKYHVRLRNMRFFNEMLKKTPKVMG